MAIGDETMTGTDNSTRCEVCGGPHDTATHTCAEVAANEVVIACREARVDDALALDAQAQLLEARAWLAPRGFSARATIELQIERRRRAA